MTPRSAPVHVHQTIKELDGVDWRGAEPVGTHSLRIGGATALFAAGANETIIRTMGRWLELGPSTDPYVLACFEQCCEWTRKAGSTQVTDVAGEFDEVDSLLNLIMSTSGGEGTAVPRPQVEALPRVVAESRKYRRMSGGVGGARRRSGAE